MLIIPVENKPDWRHPPVVTLLLILANVWVYFALAESDEDALANAFQSYVAGGLIAHEAELFVTYSNIEPPDTAQQLIPLIVVDRGFDEFVEPHLAAHRDWREARASFVDKRDQVAWIRWSLVPADAGWLNFLTSMFLHGGMDHLLGNMAFLFLFGFALERALGTVNYAALYLLGGLAGGALHVVVQADSFVPTIGASGAVSALMGGYLAVYQLRKIRFFYSVLVYFGEFRAPALVVLPAWVLKEIYGYAYGDEGIAYWDHVGGLVGGAIIGYLAVRLSRRVDTDYLETSAREQAAKKQIERLEELIDNFKFDQARALASRHLTDQPLDVGMWQRYLHVLGSNKDDPEYHRAVKQVLQLATNKQAVTSAQMDQLLETTYREYVAGKQPKPALRDPALLCALGKQFARTRKLDIAGQIANDLLKAERKDPELAQLLSVLSAGLSSSGSGQLARHYRAELTLRFPDAV
jgi:membrane associated rhomboid family serine protease